ncbi:hypothetical protein H2199_003232 [Coniosporium tulheliwenetii]|uniref:Uncharacterized protein n=1 Tax=Coniosporium tulheliwenetii TaxID=3383036 RepID=A0ACC2ZC01_9PEZI|nr:hypothetical protein H2199_003232 [Cladosporium sp. JES 115]
MTAQAHEIVTDPFLTSVLSAADLARQQCVALLDLLDQHPQLPNTPKLLYSYLAQVRGLNRSAILGVRQTKQATAEARQEIDTLHLQLQNLYYEQRHLRGRLGLVRLMRSCRHKYQQLPLIPVEEFLEKFPEHMGDDENALMIARINHEHAERQALEESRQGLLKKKQGLIAKNKKQRDDLAKLDKDLEKFIEAANPIMKTFEKEY